MHFRRKLLLNLLKLSDVAILMMALVLALGFVTNYISGITFGQLLSLRIKIVNLVGLLGMIVLWQIIYHYFHLYRSRRLQKRSQEYWDIVKATTAGTSVLFLGGIIFNVSVLTLPFTFVFWLSTTFLTISFRTLLRYALSIVRLHDRNLRLILIAGTNERAYEFARTIEENKGIGYRIIGYVDDTIHLPKEGINLLGTLEDFSNIIRNKVIDEIIITLPIKSQYKKIQGIIEKAEEQGIVVRHLSNLFNTKVATSRTGTFNGFPVLEMVAGLQDDWRGLVKRDIDIVIGSVLLLLTIPLMLVAAIAVKLTSHGSVFFIQDRVGYNKRIFPVYKFRTMVKDAEKLQQELEAQNEMDGPVFKVKNDPRITKVGRWLRKTSIDELPQLFNVIQGDMSLVGPRPLPVRDYEGFGEDWQRRRFSIRPGLTCFWQISGRNNTSFEDWMKLDMEYIDNWSLSGDLKILLKTIPTVINGKGAS